MTTTPHGQLPEALQARLHELFEYQDGKLINRLHRLNQMPSGSVAGHVTKKGYTNIRVDGRMYKAHRLIFLYHHGYIPEIIDHIDCDRENNRIENLRACTKSQNGMNRAGAYGKSGVRNVYQRGGKFQVHIRREGATHYFGTFETVEAASSGRKNLRSNKWKTSRRRCGSACL